MSPPWATNEFEALARAGAVLIIGVFQRATQLGCKIELSKRINEALAESPYVVACEYGHLSRVLNSDEKLFGNTHSLFLLNREEETAKILWQRKFSVV